MTLRLQSVTVPRPVHYLGLQFLLGGVMGPRVEAELTNPDAFYFKRLSVLNNSTLVQLAPAVRARATALTNDVTRAVSDEDAAADWQVDWKGGYFLAVTTITRDSVGVALYRPEARRLAPLLLAMLEGDVWSSQWRSRLDGFQHPPDAIERPTACLVANWHFDDAAGSRAEDSSGNDHHATLHGGATFSLDVHP